MSQIDDLIYKLLEKAEQPNTDNSEDKAEALFCTTDEAATLVESDSPKAPSSLIITQGQQRFRWDGEDRPIFQLLQWLRAYESLSVQLSSRQLTTTPFKEVSKRFLYGAHEIHDPCSIQLPSPLPQLILPEFLMGKNCNLLPQARIMALGMESTANVQQQVKWRDTAEWVVLSEGGFHTAPQIAKYGFGIWMTVQEGPIGFGWLSNPTVEELFAWLDAPSNYTGGRWRYIVLKTG